VANAAWLVSSSMVSRAWYVSHPPLFCGGIIRSLAETWYQLGLVLRAASHGAAGREPSFAGQRY
jgi:hypothetical protein